MQGQTRNRSDTSTKTSTVTLNLIQLGEEIFDYHWRIWGEFNLYIWFVLVKVLSVSRRAVATWCCLDSSSALLPLESCLCSNPASCSLLRCIHIALMIMGVDSCLMQQWHQRRFLIAAPLHLTRLKCICSPPRADRLMCFWNTSVKVY